MHFMLKDHKFYWLNLPRKVQVFVGSMTDFHECSIWTPPVTQHTLSRYSWWPFHHDQPDLSPCDFFLKGYVKGLAFVLPLPANIEEMKQRITAALETITEEMLQQVWHELEYRLNVCWVTGCAHIEHSWKSVIEPTNTCTFLGKFSQ